MSLGLTIILRFELNIFYLLTKISIQLSLKSLISEFFKNRKTTLHPLRAGLIFIFTN